MKEKKLHLKPAANLSNKPGPLLYIHYKMGADPDLIYTAIPLIKDCSLAVPVGVNNQINIPQLIMTVIQKTKRKDNFLDLWRNFC